MEDDRYPSDYVPEKLKDRSYCFTLNNPTADEIKHIESIICTYLCYQHELAPTTGTPHLQAYIVFVNPRRWGAVKQELGRRVNFRKCKGGPQANVDYATDPTKRDPAFPDYFVQGKQPMSQAQKGQSNKDRYAVALALAREGKFKEIDADLYTRHRSTYHKIYEESKEDPDDLEDHDNYWLWGVPNGGKSFRARLIAGGKKKCYFKNYKAEWEQYKGQDYIVIEEWDPKFKHLTPMLKVWTDIYSFIADVKFGSAHIRPKTIIVTSNYPMEQCFDPTDLPAMKKRFKVFHYPKRFDDPEFVDSFVQAPVAPIVEASSKRMRIE